jgi:hypothetical protein
MQNGPDSTRPLPFVRALTDKNAEACAGNDSVFANQVKELPAGNLFHLVLSKRPARNGDGNRQVLLAESSDHDGLN